ncbi:MAG: hypothetical protein M3350_06490 [Actinomycetota bacterium]|nr:hypothetical protein [Actinomycetota bacterium]
MAPTGQRPLSGNPSGGQPQPQNNEDIVVGRARGEKDAQGYHGHITVAALLGNELVGVDTRPGQTQAGPLNAVQQGLLTPLCNGTNQQICLVAAQADSKTTGSSSTNRFAVARAQIGGPAGITTGVAESRGDASEDANCQTSSGSASVTNAQVGTGVRANAANSRSSSTSCNDGTGSQTNASQVLGLNGTGVPLPAAACGTGGEVTTGLPPLAPIVCNASDINGVGETVTQAAQRYGVQEALSVFALDVGGTALLKTTTSAAESLSQAPGGPDDGPPPDDGGGGGGGGDDDDDGDNEGGSGAGGPGGPGAGAADADDGAGDGRGGDAAQCEDGIDNDGDGRTDFPNDPGCSSAQDDSEANGLAFTGLNILVILGIGLVLTPIGLQLGAAIRRRPGMS